jgi:hypothetical protein
MFGRKTKSANDSFLIAAAKDKMGSRPTEKPPVGKKASMAVKSNLHPASPRQKLGAIGTPKKTLSK